MTPELENELYNLMIPFQDNYHPVIVRIGYIGDDGVNDSEGYLSNCIAGVIKHNFWEWTTHHPEKRTMELQSKLLHHSNLTIVKPYWKETPWFYGKEYDVDVEANRLRLLYQMCVDRVGPEPVGCARAKNVECDRYYHLVTTLCKDIPTRNIAVHPITGTNHVIWVATWLMGVYAPVFDEIIQSLKATLRVAVQAEDRFVICFGAHYEMLDPIPNLSETIIFQTEYHGSRWFTKEYREKLKRAKQVWDYSSVNMKMYDAKVQRHVPMRYCKELEWPVMSPPSKEDSSPFTVGICGAMSERRQVIVDQCLKQGIRIKHIGNDKLIFGYERDKEWNNCAVALCVSCFDEHQPVAQARVAPLLANNRFVLCECAPDQDDFQGPMYVRYNQLVETLLELSALTPIELWDQARNQSTKFKAMVM